MDNEKDKYNNNLFKYFFVVGNPFSINYNIPIQEINSLKKEIENANPILISSYSIDNNSEDYLQCKNDILNDRFLQENIFPSKFNYMNQLDLSLEIEEINIKKGVFEDYTKLSKNNTNMFFHCFKFTDVGDKYYEWYFNVLIIYEPILFFNKQSTNIFCGKALIIISNDEYFTLSKFLLEKIYNQKYISNQVPIEKNIIEIFNNLIFNKYDINNEKNINRIFISNYEYIISNEAFLPNCDLDISLFFRIFALSDILLIIEYYFRNKTIIISSPNVNILYPIYHILLNFIFPFNITDSTYVYKLLTPSNISQVLFSFLPCFLFIYSDKPLNNDLFKKIISIKDDEILYFHILFEDDKISTKPIFYELNNEGNVHEITHQSLILNILKKNDKDSIISFICKEMENINTFDIKIFDDLTILNFFNISEDFHKIKTYFLSLILKFFVSIFDIGSLDFCIENDKIKIEVNKEKNEFEFISEIDGIETLPSFEVIYKNNAKLNDNLNKTRNALDELIKITKSDKNRIYFNLEVIDKYKNDKNNIYDIDNLFNLNYERKIRYHYLNIYNRFRLRNPNESKYFKIITENNEDFIKYKNFRLNFDIFLNNNNNNNDNNDLINNINKIEEQSKYINLYYSDKIIYYEIENFYGFLKTNNIEFKNKKEVIIVDIGLMISLICINKCNSKNLNDSYNIDYLFISFYNLFLKEKKIFTKFSFLLSLMFKIIISNDKLNKKYKQIFINELKIDNILPTISIYLLYNNNINFFDKEIYENKIDLNFNIEFIEKIEQNGHNFDLINNINDNYECKDIIKGEKCKEILLYKIKIKNEKEKIIPILSPLYSFKRLINFILKNKNMYCNDLNEFYGEWKFDLQLIALYYKLYYDIILFPEFK